MARNELEIVAYRRWWLLPCVWCLARMANCGVTVPATWVEWLIRRGVRFTHPDGTPLRCR